MIDLSLNQYKIQEIKYEVKEGKTVIFKLHNFNLYDVEIIEETKQEKPYCETNMSILDSDVLVDKQESDENKSKPVGEMDVKELGKAVMEYLKEKEPKEGEHPFSRKVKELHDYEPTSCLEKEKGMQETLEASRKKEWYEDVKKKPSSPTETGNALIPKDNTYMPLIYKKATKEEINEFRRNQKNKDIETNKTYQNKVDKKLVTDLVKAKKIIDEYVTKTSGVEKKRFEDRVKDKYFKLDPDDDFSKIKSLGDLNNKLIENSKKDNE